MTAFRYEIGKDNIAIVTLDLPDEKVNKLSTPVMIELNSLLDTLAVRKDIKALVFRSGKAGSFIVGADIAEIRGLTAPDAGERVARTGQEILAKIESLPFPTVAAIHGPCMGGGMELALACAYRVISNDPRTAFALPEVKLGIIPGFGGTQRLPRLLGLTNALDLILTGKSVYASKARRLGLADAVTYPETLLPIAVATAKNAVGRPRPSGIRGRRPFMVKMLEDNPFTRPLVYAMAKKTVLKETRGNYPAPPAALDAVRLGLSRGLAAGYHNEARLLGELACSEISKNLISIFYLNELLKKDPFPSPMNISYAGVLGAGIMGGGIAQLFAEKGLPVRMKDINTKAVGAGFKAAADIFKKRRKKGILNPLQARNGLDRITGATDYTGFGRADLVVEAVVENMDIKKTVLRDFEAVAAEHALFASNTSSLSITELSSASRHPEQVVGMHFFNPVEKMPLVEVVRGKKTSEAAVSAIATLSRKLGKLPVIVNDGPGFLVNRILMPYLNEAAMMLEQGGMIEEIDKTLLQFGMPMGAFLLLDEIGIDVANKVSVILQQGLGARVKPSGLLDALYKKGYYGKKNGKGFYLYEGKKRKGPDTSVYQALPVAPAGREKLGQDEIVDRAVLLMIKEAALCLEEKIIERADLLDAALIFGIGFPPFRGGLLRYTDKLGLDVAVKKLEACSKKYGERFTPPASLLAMAKAGKTFYA
jgi:3-hydroxyacyl-CoA dehydrogenase/enoyl-CoA hydratase/3-hydroxybutyryl-CoA epimerase